MMNWQKRKRFKSGRTAAAYPQKTTLWHLYRNGRARCGRAAVGDLIAESLEVPGELGQVCYLCRRQQAIWQQLESHGAVVPARKRETPASI
jgi:hypothetical protein